MDNTGLTELMEQALYESRIIVECPVCYGELTIEPDADEAWCMGCERLVKNINPLIRAGLM